MKSIFVAAAAIAGMTAVPVLAQPETATTAASAAPAAVVPAKTQQTKYCISDVLTGTRMTTKQCKTRKEWADEGVDIDRPNR